VNTRLDPADAARLIAERFEAPLLLRASDAVGARVEVVA
jgi:hypothetical protein